MALGALVTVSVKLKDSVDVAPNRLTDAVGASYWAVVQAVGLLSVIVQVVKPPSVLAPPLKESAEPE